MQFISVEFHGQNPEFKMLDHNSLPTDGQKYMVMDIPIMGSLLFEKRDSIIDCEWVGSDVRPQ
jgi:hypothetical protein